MCVPVRNETQFNYLKMYSQGVIHNIFSCQINFTQTTHTDILVHIILACKRTRTSANTISYHMIYVQLLDYSMTKFTAHWNCCKLHTIVRLNHK